MSAGKTELENDLRFRQERPNLRNDLRSRQYGPIFDGDDDLGDDLIFLMVNFISLSPVDIAQLYGKSGTPSPLQLGAR